MHRWANLEGTEWIEDSLVGSFRGRSGKCWKGGRAVVVVLVVVAVVVVVVVVAAVMLLRVKAPLGYCRGDRGDYG